MKWSKISDYAIQSGPYKIAKCMVLGNEFFVLSANGETHAIYNSASDAKSAASKLEREAA